MNRSVIVPQGSGELSGRERHHALPAVDVHVELIEEVTPEHAVGAFDRHVLRSYGHAADARLADLEAVDLDELHPAGSRRARDLDTRRRSGDTHTGRLERARAD